MKFTEAANAQASQTAAISVARGLHEAAEAHGVYTATLMGPLEHEREQYIKVRDQLDQHKHRGIPYRLLKRKEIKALEAELASFVLEEKWQETFDNVVCTVGKNVMLDAALAGSAYTVVGPYIGLISSVGYTAVAAADTMTSHAGWTEAGITNAPTYSGGRKTAAWSVASAGAKSLSAPQGFSITGSGTIKGCFMVYFTGAVATVDNTAGTLYSAGLFSAPGDRIVSNGDTLNVSYSTSL